MKIEAVQVNSSKISTFSARFRNVFLLQSDKLLPVFRAGQPPAKLLQAKGKCDQLVRFFSLGGNSLMADRMKIKKGKYRGAAVLFKNYFSFFFFLILPSIIIEL